MIIIAGILTLFVHLPIWFYLMYYILTTIQASELVMFLFWIYVPVSILTTIATKIIESENKK